MGKRPSYFTSSEFLDAGSPSNIYVDFVIRKHFASFSFTHFNFQESIWHFILFPIWFAPHIDGSETNKLIWYSWKKFGWPIFVVISMAQSIKKENGRNFIASFPRDCIKVKEGLFSADLLLPQSRNLVELQGHLPYQPPASFYWQRGDCYLATHWNYFQITLHTDSSPFLDKKFLWY